MADPNKLSQDERMLIKLEKIFKTGTRDADIAKSLRDHYLKNRSWTTKQRILILQILDRHGFKHAKSK